MSNRAAIWSSAVCLLALASSARAGGRVWIVAETGCPDVDFTTAQEAIDAASDGDTILLRASLLADFGPIEIVQKSLVVAVGAENQAAGTITLGDITIRDLLPSQSATLFLRRPDTSGNAVLTGGLVLEDNAGPIWLEEGWVFSSFFTDPDLEQGARIENCASVTLIRWRVVAPAFTAACPPGDPCLSVDGYPGMRVSSSTVHLFDCTVFGTKGAPGFDPFDPGGGVAGDGGAAIVVEDSTLHVFEGQLNGGDGGTGGPGTPQPFCADGGDGGACITVSDLSSTVRIKDADLRPGDEGPWASPALIPTGCQDGAPGVDFDGPGAGTVESLPGFVPNTLFQLPHVLQEGDVETLAILGELGDTFAFVGFGAAPAVTYDPVLQGLAAFVPFRVVNLGTMTDSFSTSSASLSVVIPDLVAPGESVTLYVQSYVFDSALQLQLGTPTHRTVLDASHDLLDGCQDELFVDDDAPGDPGPGDPLVSDPLEDGSSARPYDTIEEAIQNAPFYYMTIRVADGTYVPPASGPISLYNNRFTVESMNGPANCIVDAMGADTAFRFDSLLVPALSLKITLRGLTVRGAADRAIVLRRAPYTIDGCIIEGNAGNDGAGISMFQSDSRVSNCIVRDNHATNLGGGIYAQQCGPVITNCEIVGNSASEGGGFLGSQEGALIRNSTIADNMGGGLQFDLSASVPATATVWNTIVWGNTGGDQVALENGRLVLRYADIEGWPSGVSISGAGVLTQAVGVLGLDPLFVDPLVDDYHLSALSPCIDAGDPAFVPAPGETDLDGDPRVQGAAVDLGSDEF